MILKINSKSKRHTSNSFKIMGALKYVQTFEKSYLASQRKFSAFDGLRNKKYVTRLMPFRPLFPCVPWSSGTNNITLK